MTLSGWSPWDPWGGPGYSYYYIDDVCISTDSMYCNITDKIQDVSITQDVILSPNPFQNNINITTNRNELVEVHIYDVTARKILNKKFMSTVSLNTEQLEKGIYIYEVRNKNGVLKNGKIVKE